MKLLKIIIGSGKTGLSVVDYLMKYSDCRVVLMDTRQNAPGIPYLKAHYPDLPYFYGELPSDILFAAEEIIVSPGVSLQEPIIQKCLQEKKSVISDIELFARVARAPVVAITGSNGKSTVTTLMGEVIRACGFKVGVGGNLGTPALALLDQKVDYYVLELSSFQLETTNHLAARVATILNISEDHLDRYHSMADYIAVKQRIFSKAQAVVINYDDKLSFRGTLLPSRQQFFSLSDRKIAYHLEDAGIYFKDEKLLTADEIPIKGLHNLANVLVVLAMSNELNLPKEPVLEAIRNFKGLPHRCVLVGTIGGVNWYNDSKGTNVGATIAALEGLGPITKGKIILLAGGLGKGADFTLLRSSVLRYVKKLILFGRDALLIKQALCNYVATYEVASLSEAIRYAADQAREGDVVLLSPACASFDMFASYETRGEAFTELVKELNNEITEK